MKRRRLWGLVALLALCLLGGQSGLAREQKAANSPKPAREPEFEKAQVDFCFDSFKQALDQKNLEAHIAGQNELTIFRLMNPKTAAVVTGKVSGKTVEDPMEECWKRREINYVEVLGNKIANIYIDSRRGQRKDALSPGMVRKFAEDFTNWLAANSFTRGDVGYFKQSFIETLNSADDNFNKYGFTKSDKNLFADLRNLEESAQAAAKMPDTPVYSTPTPFPVPIYNEGVKKLPKSRNDEPIVENGSGTAGKIDGILSYSYSLLPWLFVAGLSILLVIVIFKRKSPGNKISHNELETVLPPPQLVGTLPERIGQVPGKDPSKGCDDCLEFILNNVTKKLAFNKETIICMVNGELDVFNRMLDNVKNSIFELGKAIHMVENKLRNENVAISGSRFSELGEMESLRRENANFDNHCAAEFQKIEFHLEKAVCENQRSRLLNSFPEVQLLAREIDGGQLHAVLTGLETVQRLLNGNVSHCNNLLRVKRKLTHIAMQTDTILNRSGSTDNNSEGPDYWSEIARLRRESFVMFLLETTNQGFEYMDFDLGKWGREQFLEFADPLLRGIRNRDETDNLPPESIKELERLMEGILTAAGLEEIRVIPRITLLNHEEHTNSSTVIDSYLPEGTVVALVRSGFRIKGGRVLKRAEVVVSRH